VPPFSGFFSKEEILLAAYQSDKFIFIIALLTSALTAFYMFRLYFSIFFAKPFSAEGVHHGPQHEEAPVTMKVPLVVLAVGSTLAGLVPFGRFVTMDGRPSASHVNITLAATTVLLTIAGIFLARWLYQKENQRPARIATALGGFYKATTKKFYLDELYLFFTKSILFRLIGAPAAWIDKNIVDGSVNKLADVTMFISEKSRKLQSGKVQEYGLYFFGGIAVLVMLVLYIWKP
jgi:NADH-quinone oxidoreductase subunit L